MSEMNEIKKVKRSDRYRGRITQVPIYIGKFFRMFVYQNDWKVVPMAGFIAMLVSFVVRDTYYVSMEGTLKGAVAMMCVALWNGFFNSIQVVCRERSIIKREHRSGMHITSYIFAHMVYQAFLCGLQTVATVVVFIGMKVHFPENAVVSGSFIVDFTVTLFLITYAADMLSLFISCLVKSTTAAMTVMPLVLMVQLIFSGGLFSVPASMQPLSAIMISNHGGAALAAEGDYNDLPAATGWLLIEKMGNREGAEVEVKQAVEMLKQTGMDNKIKMETAKSGYNEKYVNTYGNIKHRWHLLLVFAGIYALCAVITLEFIDRDRR